MAKASNNSDFREIIAIRGAPDDLQEDDSPGSNSQGHTGPSPFPAEAKLGSSVAPGIHVSFCRETSGTE
jgi:hypothetical protein